MRYVTWKIITALLFPPAIFTVQFKSAKELQYMPQTQEEHEQELESQDVASYNGSERENFNMDNQANDTHEKEYSDVDHNELSHHQLVDSNNRIVSEPFFLNKISLFIISLRRNNCLVSTVSADRPQKCCTKNILTITLQFIKIIIIIKKLTYTCQFNVANYQESFKF